MHSWRKMAAFDSNTLENGDWRNMAPSKAFGPTACYNQAFKFIRANQREQEAARQSAGKRIRAALLVCDFRNCNSKEAFAKADAAANRALQLDSMLAEAHSSLRFVPRGIELNSNLATTHDHTFLKALGRFKEAQEELESSPRAGSALTFDRH